MYQSQICRLAANTECFAKMNAVAMFCLYFRQKGKKMVISRVGEYKYRRGCEFKLIPYGCFFIFSQKKECGIKYLYNIIQQILTFHTWDDPTTSSSGNAVEERDTFISSFFFGYFCFFTLQKNSISCGSLVLYTKYFTLFLLFFKKVAIIKSNQGGGEKKF